MSIQQEYMYTRYQLLEDVIAPIIRGKRSNKVFECGIPFNEFSECYLQDTLRARTIDTPIGFLKDCKKPFYSEPFFQLVHSRDSGFIPNETQQDLHRNSNYNRSVDLVNRQKPKFSNLLSTSSKSLNKSKSVLNLQEDVSRQRVKLSTRLFGRNNMRDRWNTSKRKGENVEMIPISHSLDSHLPSSPFPINSERSNKTPSSPIKSSDIPFFDLEDQEGNETITLVDEQIEGIKMNEELTRTRLQRIIQKERNLMEIAKVSMLERMRTSQIDQGQYDSEEIQDIDEKIPGTINPYNTSYELPVEELATEQKNVPKSQSHSSDDEATDDTIQQKTQLQSCSLNEDSTVMGFSILGRAILLSCKSKNIIPKPL